MKRIFVVLMMMISMFAKSQTLDTVNVSLTMRAQDWAWAIGKYGTGTDSASMARVRAIRTAIIAANPASWTTNVTINDLSGKQVMFIYNTFISAPFGEVLAMGNNTAERTTIYTNIRAISNSALQYFIGKSDTRAGQRYTNSRGDGKAIILDN